jgi:hypothetical protein
MFHLTHRLFGVTLFTLFLLVVGDDWFADEMYYTSTSSYPCVTVLNNDAEMGCTCRPLSDRSTFRWWCR